MPCNICKKNCDSLPLEFRMCVTELDLTWWSLADCTHSNSFDSKYTFASTIVVFMALHLFICSRLWAFCFSRVDYWWTSPNFVKWSFSITITFVLLLAIGHNVKHRWIKSQLLSFNKIGPETKNHKCQQFQNVDKLVHITLEQDELTYKWHHCSSHFKSNRSCGFGKLTSFTMK